jgi:hypothetical protein
MIQKRVEIYLTGTRVFYVNSVFLAKLICTIHLEKLLNSKYGEKAHIDSILKEFDKTAKKRFKGSGDTMIKFSNDIRGRDLKVGIRSGQIKITA